MGEFTKGRPAATFLRIRFERDDEILCGSCQCPLDRHQPDPERPERLLGTCPGCEEWYLINIDTRVMVLLPDPDDLGAL